MKYIILLSFLLNTQAFADSDCTSELKKSESDVEYNVNTAMPKHLRGATITITTADGRSSSVPAEKFMVVPRKQQTVVGKSISTEKVVRCNVKQTKNLVFVEASKQYTGVQVQASGNSASVSSKKEIVPSLNYYRRDILGNIGAGAGLDTSGHGKAMIGLDF